MRYISVQEIAALNISIAEATEAVRKAHLAARNKEIVWWPKTSLSGTEGAFSSVTHALWETAKLSICHSIVGTAPANVPARAPHYASTQILGDLSTGQCLAVYDGSLTSNLLPVAVTALGARHLADPQSETATFVGAGTQARLHLDMLSQVFPLRHVHVLTRSTESARAFCRYSRDKGLECTIEQNPQQAIERGQLVVTAVSSAAGMKPFLNPDWLSAGAFLSAVDLGRSWDEGMHGLDLRVTDDRAQADMQERDGRMPHHGPYDLELADIVAATTPSRQSPDQRIALIHPGNVVGVLGITWLIHQRMEKVLE